MVTLPAHAAGTMPAITSTLPYQPCPTPPHRHVRRRRKIADAVARYCVGEEAAGVRRRALFGVDVRVHGPPDQVLVAVSRA